MVYKVLGDYSKLIEEQKTDSSYFIGIDIGGTNTRVVYATENGDYYTIKEFLCSSITVLLEELTKIQDECLGKFIDPEFCCIDLAGPHLSKNKYKLTNYIETDNFLFTEKLPSKLCPPNKFAVLNDLESGAYGIIPFMKTPGGLDSIFSTIVEHTGILRQPENCVYPVLAAGTGLGVGLITKFGDQYKVIPSEFGHISICSDTHDCEQELFKNLQNIIKEKEISRTNYSLEYEDIVSGRGVQALYNIMKHKDEPERNNAEIANQAALNPKNADCSCVKTMKIHYQYLIRCAREISVGTFGASVFLIGDNIVRNNAMVCSIKPALANEFLDHPKLEWLSTIPVFGQKVIINLNLIGCIFYASSQFSKKN
ncbi:hypothetical protein RB653_005958 [Dictyostelium firmibasis]|uniref:Glucokinase n=1 Tax=Dictyostelium firmibasis TaxID=79012 RepID=A0AAN7U285_9MYCE